MERIESLFPRYDENGKALIYKAFRIAEDALASELERYLEDIEKTSR